MSRKGSCKYSEDEVRAWVDHYAISGSVQKTADAFGLSWGVVRGPLFRLGVIVPFTKGGRRKKFTEADVLKWGELHQDGYSVREIGALSGADWSHINRTLQNRGLKTRGLAKPRSRSKYTPEMIAELANDYVETGSTRKTGANFGIDGSQVHKLLKPLGVVPDVRIPEEERKATQAKNEAINRERIRADPERFLAASLKKHHGDSITLTRYQKMVEAQDNRCKICDEQPNLAAERKANRRLFVDHDHSKTGSASVRELLCVHCNSGVGYFKDSIELLESAISYLQKPPAVPAVVLLNPDEAKAFFPVTTTSKYLRGWRDMLAKEYGLSVPRYEELATLQCGLCAICSQPQTNGKRLCVDHDHATRSIRGLLDTRCNFGLGHFRDSPTILRSAITYLETHRLHHEVSIGSEIPSGTSAA